MANSGLSTSINASVQRLEARYGISFKYADFPKLPDNLKFTEVPSSEYRRLNDYLSLFEEEINKYPSGFFADQDVRGVGLVRALFSSQKAAQGLYNEQARIMFFDISRYNRNKAQQRHAIHHEIFHMMLQKKGYPLLNEQWAELNTPGFSYGKQTKPLRELNPYNVSAPNQLGFVTYYAMQSVQEDQAEVFACLMQEKHRRLIEQWAVKDSVLAAKIQMIKDFAQYYHPEMDETYWKKEKE